MATNVAVVINCDLEDGKDKAREAETVTFGIDGTGLEIDLCAKHRAALEKALAPYIEHGRRVRSSGQERQARRSSSSGQKASSQASAIRAWAAQNGIEVSSHGRIARGLAERWEAEQGSGGR